jgi:hypothetical protein
MKPMNSIENKNNFGPILESDEQILWTGKPFFPIFLATGIPFLIFGLLWGAFDLQFVHLSQKTGEENINGFLIPFMAIHLAPFYLSVLNILRLSLVYKNTLYAVTNKRLLFRGGFFGINYKSLEYDKIQNIEVAVNPLEKICNVGTIKAQTAGFAYNQGFSFNGQFNSNHKIIGISSPYEVFKKIKETSSLVKDSQLLI